MTSIPNIPLPYQIELAHELVHRGAILVLGHHPHVVQGLKHYGNALIAYSLGNFIFDQNWSDETKSGLMLRIRMKGGELDGFEPVVIKQGSDYIPRPCKDNFNDELLSGTVRFSNDPEKYKEYVTARQNWARRAMKLELLVNLKYVSLSTLVYPLLRRVQQFTLPSDEG